jgi:transcriptional regulator with XRE-family HTH domain
MKTLGQYIRELRERKDLSLRDLARRVDISAPFLSDVELGRRNTSEKVLAKIAHVLGTTLEELQSLDTRPPIDELRRLTTSDPSYGLAFRMVIDKKVSSKDLMDLANRKPHHSKKKE